MEMNMRHRLPSSLAVLVSINAFSRLSSLEPLSSYLAGDGQRIGSVHLFDDLSDALHGVHQAR